MNSIRIQIHLKYVSDDNSSKGFYNFWYAFQPSNMLTINEILEDIRLNYLKDNDEQSFIIHLDDCQLLPFTSSQILRDNDQLILMPIVKYKLHKKSLQDTITLNSISSILIESPPGHKRQRIESIEQNIPTESTITIIKTNGNIDEQPPSKKKTKTKSVENEVILPLITQPTPEPVITKSTPVIFEASVVEKEVPLDAPVSLPSTNGRIRELKSKIPAWKAQPSQPKGNPQDKLHIRFDSESEEEPLPSTEPIIDEEPLPLTKPVIEEKTIPEALPLVNGSNSSVRVHYVPSLPPTNIVEKPNEIPKQKKTIDLLFEMKQCKTPAEKKVKTIQQQHGKKRAQSRKRAIGYISMANFVDQAFGLDKDDHETQTLSSSNGYHTSSSTPPQALPTSFNKLARLPLVAEAIESNDKIYDLYPPVSQYPSIQSRIAFKLLELSEDFCPNMSAFKEGTVINVNHTTGELTIQLDQPLQTVFDQASKFYAPTDDLLEEELTTVILPFSDLNSVRLLSTSNGNEEK